jgi:outer membrane protein OmpA-like peptidoglycan-associated protein
MWIINTLPQRLTLAGLGRTVGVLLALGIALPASALDLSLAFSAQLTTRVVTAPDSHALPVGPFTEAGLPLLDLEGQVERQVFRFAGQSLTTLQLLAPLRDQLIAAGYETLFECEDIACGGFDFRFAIEVLPAPDMYVDLTDFRFLAARRGGQDHIGLLVSGSANAGFVQMIRVTNDPDADALRVTTPGDAPREAESDQSPVTPVPEAAQSPMGDDTPTPAAPQSLADSLRLQGHVILADLSFQTGSSQLSEGSYPSLDALASFLLADPSRRIALVGHTDTVGGLSGNIALSKERALSVRQRLVQAYSVPASQLDAEGMGYLSPIAPNTTAEGRDANRRVEAVLLNTE